MRGWCFWFEEDGKGWSKEGLIDFMQVHKVADESYRVREPGRAVV